MRHDDQVMSVAFSPDGARIASGSIDNTVRVWDVGTGRPVGQPMRHDDQVMSVAFSPDGVRIASGSLDSTVRVWDAGTGRPVGQPMRHDQGVLSVAFSPDGARIASGGIDKTVRLWNADAGSPGPQLLHDDAVMSVAFSPDGARIASSSYDNAIRLWDAMAAARDPGVLLGHEAPGGAALWRSAPISTASRHLVLLRRVHDGTCSTLGCHQLATHARPLAKTQLGPRSSTMDAASARAAAVTIRQRDGGTPPRGGPLVNRCMSTTPMWTTYSQSTRTTCCRCRVGPSDTAQLWDARNSQPIGEPLHPHRRSRPASRR